MPRAKHTPTQEMRAMVQAMAINGVPHEDIANAFILFPGVNKKITRPTLDKYYKVELQSGPMIANARVTASLFQKAIGSGTQSVTAAIFWMKTRGGWRESPQTIEFKIEDIDMSLATDEELAMIRAGQVTKELIDRLMYRKKNNAAASNSNPADSGSG